MTVSPERIQRKRTKGWRLPPNAIYVGRPTRWGNPWHIEAFMGGWSLDGPHAHFGVFETETAARREAVRMYRQWITSSQTRGQDLVPILAGHDLCCWCPLDQPCHGDALLDLARGAA